MDESSKELEVMENSNLVIEPTGCTIEGDRTDSIEDHEIEHKTTSTSSLTSRTSVETSKSSESKINDNEDNEDEMKDGDHSDNNDHEKKIDEQQSSTIQNENKEQCKESIQSTELSEKNENLKNENQDNLEKLSNFDEESSVHEKSKSPEFIQNNELIEEISQKLNIKLNNSNELDENKTEPFENSENLSQFIADENVSNNATNTTTTTTTTKATSNISKDIQTNSFQYIYDDQKPFIYSSKQPPANSLVPAIISELKQKLEYSSSNNQDDDKYVDYDEQKSHLVYDHITSMNSQTNDKINYAENQMKTFTYHETITTNTTTTSSTDNTNLPNKINDNYISNKEHKFDFNSKEQPPRRLPAFYKPRPQTVTTVGPQVVLNPNTESHPSANYQSHVKLNTIQNVPTFISPNRFYPQSHISTSPTRKTTNNNIHIGSEIISIESGPSITIYLRRPNSERSWGFNFYGGAEYGCPPFVNKITNNGLAHVSGVEVGDVIVSICGSLTVGKTFGQIKAEILRAGNELDLILIRRGVDLNQISRVAPHVLVNTPSTPTTTNRSFSFENEDTTKRFGTRSLTRGRSFRPVQTKSLRMLEEQLNAAENQMFVPKVKQNYQTSRDINVSGLKSSFAPAYGQTRSQIYIDNQSKPLNTQSVSKVICPSTHHAYSKSVQYTTSSNQFPSQQSHNWLTHSMDPHNVHWVEATPSTNYNYITETNQNYMVNSYSENNDSISSRSVPMYHVTPQNPYRSQYQWSSEM